MRIFKRIVSLILMLCVLMSIGSCVRLPLDGGGTSNTVANPGNGAHSEEKEMLTIAKKGESEFQIVYSMGAEKDVVEKCKELSRHIEEITGAIVPVVHDGAPVKENEILIGNAFRTQTDSIVKKSELKDLDYLIQVVGTRIVIAGSNEFATITAMDAFMDTIADKSEQRAEFAVEKNYVELNRSGKIDPVKVLERAETYLDFTWDMSAKTIVICRLTFTGNNGWRIQTKDSAVEKFEDIGASQLLSLYAGEEPVLDKMALTVKTENPYLVVWGPDNSRAEINRFSTHINFYTPTGKLAATITDITVDNDGSAITGVLKDDEAVFGTGERFDTVNQRGKCIELFTKDIWSQADAHYVTTPLMCFSRGSGVFINRNECMTMDIGYSRRQCWTADVQGAPLDCYIFTTEKVADVIYGYSALSGFAELPEEWTYGMIVCRYWPDLTRKWSEEIAPYEGRNTGVYNMIAKMEAYDLPWTGLLLEGWGMSSHLEDLKEICDYVHARGKKVLLYMALATGGEGVPGSGWHDSYGLTITLPDGTVTDKIPSTSAGNNNPDAQGVSTRKYFDITNPAANQWYFDEFWYQYLATEIGVDGCKIDFCEQIPENYPINFYNQSYPTAGAHHWFPTAFCVDYWDMISSKPDGGMCYIRGGGIGLQRAPYVWGGDQIRQFISLEYQVTSMLSMGISGLPFFSYDMSGYQYGSASRDIAYEGHVFIRGTQFSAFTTCLQTHGAVRNPHDFADEGAGYVTDIYRAYLKLHELLTPYITEIAREACETGMPMMRHLVLGWQNDSNVYNIQDEFTFGDAFLVAPVLDDSFSRDIYLPEGNWMDLNSGTVYEVSAGGRTLENYQVPLEMLPVFYNIDSASVTAKDCVAGIQAIFETLQYIDIP